MKFAFIVFLGLAALAAARPESVLNFSVEDIHQEQDVEDQVVTGSYSWISPDGAEHFVKFVADKNRYRLVESNVFPASLDGVRANGEQGSFTSFEELDD